MATFNELFPDQAQAPFVPIEAGRVDPQIRAARERARVAIDTHMNGQPAAGLDGDVPFQMPSAPPTEPAVEWGDYGKGLMSGAIGLGQSVAGAGRTIAKRLGADQAAGAFNEMATDAGAASQAWLDRMTPQAQERLAKQWMSLDPTNSIWRGGLRETLGSIALQATSSAPSTVLPLLGGGMLMRLGARMTGLATIGASEAVLSMGDTSNAIRAEIQSIPDDLLAEQSQRYAQLRQQGMDEGQARETLMDEAEGHLPEIVGATVGLIGAAGGRYIEPIFTEGAGLGRRVARGAAYEGLIQEGPQNAAQQVAQNYAAQTFDKHRSLLQGSGEAFVQGAGLGGVMGGAVGALAGRGPRQAIPAPSQFEPQGGEIPPQGPPPTAGFDETFGAQQPPPGGYTGAGPLPPDLDASGQRLMDMGAVDPALQAAMNARADKLIPDMFEQPDPRAEQQGFLQRPYPVTQQALELPAPTGTDVVPQPGQQALPLPVVRGRGGVPLERVPNASLEPDLSAPPDVSMERGPTGELIPEPNVPRSGPRRADALRARAAALSQNERVRGEQARAMRYRGTVRDENQIDAFTDPESPLSDQDRAQLAQQLGEAFEITQDPRIGQLMEQANQIQTRAQAQQLYTDFASIAGLDSSPAEMRQMPDQPSAEPLGDLQAQLKDLADPKNPRRAVYLSRDNMKVLRQQGTFEQVRGAGVPIPNFDLRGGTLIAKDRATADALLAERKAGNAMQEILGRATLAGTGKALAADIAVQQRDAQGNVTRESLVVTPEEADALADSFDEGDRQGVIISAGQAIRRRMQRIKEEGRQAVATRDIKQTKRTASDIIEAELPGELGERAKRKIGRAMSENEAARNLVAYGARLRSRELKGRKGRRNIGDVLHPDTVEFEDLKANQQYRDLFNQYAESELQKETASTAADTLKSRTRSELLRRQLGALRKLNKATTASERVVRTARKISAEEVTKIEREAAQFAKRKATPDSVTDDVTRQMLERVTPEQLRDASETEINLLFAEAAEVASGSRAQRKAATKDTGGAQTREAQATTVFSPHGRSFEEIVAAHPTRSERVKLIERVQNMLERRKHGGKSKTHPITAAGGERKTALGDKVAIRRGKLNPNPALDLAPPREMSSAERAKHNARVRKAYSDLDTTVQSTQQAMMRVIGPEMARVAKARESDGNPPLKSRRAVYARAFARNLLRYGQLLQKLHPRSKAGLKEVEAFNTRMQKLLDTSKEKFLDKLSNALDAEIGVQARRTAAVDPTNLGALNSRKRRLLTAKAYNDKLEDQLRWTQRLHEKWHTNSLFNEHVAPVMQKIIGYVTRDSEMWNYSSERRGLGKPPSLKELEGLKFALKRFKYTKTARADLLKPLKRFFEEYGYKFDESDELIVPKDSTYTDTALLRAARDKTGYRYVETPAEREANEQRARNRADMIRRRAAETRRRAVLTPKQRAAEDRQLMRALEKDRRSRMTLEQRKALEALDRRDRLKLELLDLQADLPSMRESAKAAAGLLEELPRLPLNHVLKTVAARMSADNPYQAIIRRLIDLDMSDTSVGWDRTGERVKDAYGTFNVKTLESGRRVREINLSRAKYEAMRIRGNDPSPAFVHALVHEAVHAATAGTIANNPRARAAMWAIMRQARTAAIEQKVSLVSGEREFYGFRDNSVDEFVAEAFSNPVFQSKLREIKIDPKRTVWDIILDTVKRLLGLADTPRAENVLDAVLATGDKILTGEIAQPTAGREKTHELNLDAEAVRDNIANTYDKVMQSSRVTKQVHNRATDIISRSREAGSRSMLAALTMEQIGQFYNRAFGGAGGPLANYLKAFFQRNADNSANMEIADRRSREWTALTEKLGEEKAVELSRIMTEATLYGIHPNLAVSHSLNKTVTSPEQKARHAELHRRWSALDPALKEHYQHVLDYYDRSLREEAALVSLNALRGALIKGENAPMKEKDFNYTVADIASKQLNTEEGLEREFGNDLTQEMKKAIARIGGVAENRIGPYFPLMRFGDYVVTAERVKETKTFKDRKEARDWALAQKATDPTLSVSSPIDSGDDLYTIRVTEKEVRMAETPSEAEAARADMVSQYGEENVAQIQKKSQLYTRGATIASNAALDTILGKLQGNPAAQAAIKDFYLRSLSDASFRKREIRRQNRRGVNYDLQHRTFANYAKASAYYTSQLKFGWKLADELINMQKFSEKVAKGEAQSNLSPVRLADVVGEINTRDKLTTDPIEVSKLVRGGTALSQFMMLTSPSYWIINATQPYMVTLPWLAARSSVGQATAALANAQKLIASPLINQMGESWLGAKALTSKVAAEKAFTVLEQVEEHIKQRAGAMAPEYIKMLNNLRRESIIDLSFVAELRDIAEGQSTTMTQRVLDASRIMSHLTEVNNRIMTAIAAYDLYRSQGMGAEAAEGFAKQAVSLTQFNYSSGNTPRLFSARGPLGQAGPLVFQFMKYPQHIYALLIDNFRRAVSSGEIDKKIARKTLLGLFTTHLAAGGLAGAMLQPIKWAIGLTLMALGDDDEPYTLKNALSGTTFDREARKITSELFGNDLGEVLTSGLPRAAGIDVSSRMSLGSLYFIDLNTESAESTLGSLAGSFGGPLLNLGMGFVKGANYMRAGQLDKGMEFFLPKAAKDIFRAIRYTNHGLTDGTGKEIMGADQMSPSELFAQAAGFSPADVADKYAGNAAIKDKKQFDADRRKLLIQRFNNASPEERADIVAEVAEFNRGNPGARISRSQLLKSLKGFKQREQRVKRYGADLSRRQMIYEHEGDPYEDDEDSN